MLGLIREWYNVKLSELKSRVQENYALTSMTQNYLDYSRAVIDYDELFSVGAVERGLDQSYEALVKARSESRRLCRTNAHARNIQMQIVNHVVGHGFSVKFKDDAKQRKWLELEKANRLEYRRREKLRRVIRDGETLLRKFDGQQVRFIEPSHLKPPSRAPQEAPDGVETDLDDIETVNFYHVNDEPIPAEQIFHLKPPDTDLNTTRGWPVLYDARQVIERYEGFIQDRAVLNAFRAKILLFRKHKNRTGAGIKNFQDAIKDGSMSVPPSGKQQKFALLRSGSVIDHNENIEYEFKNPDTGALDAAEDGRAFRLLIACFTQFPEYLVTSDASNANFASTAVAEAPGTKAMESWQGYFATEYARFLLWLDPTLDDPVITFPVLVSRDPLKQAQACRIQWEAGALSRRTWIEVSGRDPEEELPRIAEEGGLEKPVEDDEGDEDEEDEDEDLNPKPKKEKP